MFVRRITLGSNNYHEYALLCLKLGSDPGYGSCKVSVRKSHRAQSMDAPLPENAEASMLVRPLRPPFVGLNRILGHRRSQSASEHDPAGTEENERTRMFSV